MTRLLTLIVILSGLVGCKKDASPRASSQPENLTQDRATQPGILTVDRAMVAPRDLDELLKSQLARYRSKITSATEAECMALRLAMDPTDDDLKLIYGENAKYAIAIRDAKFIDAGSDPEAVRKSIREFQKSGPIREDEVRVIVEPEDDYRVWRAKEEGLLKVDFPMRRVTVELPHIVEGRGIMIYVNGRWVDFIHLDKLHIQRANKQLEAASSDANKHTN